DSLLERLLQLSRLQARGHRFEREPVRIDEVVGDALSAFQAATLSDKVTVDVTLEAADTLLVPGDREALGQAVANLLINAWKYSTPGERKISLTARPVDRSVEITVGDNGPGVDREEAARIFDQFERG